MSGVVAGVIDVVSINFEIRAFWGLTVHEYSCMMNPEGLAQSKAHSRKDIEMKTIKFINRNVNGATVDYEMPYGKIADHITVSKGNEGRSYAKANSERVARSLEKRATPLSYKSWENQQWEVEVTD